MTALVPALESRGACGDAVAWARDLGDVTLCTAWRACPRGDWLLWIAGRVGVDRRLLVQAACDCAETALCYVPEGEERPRRAIETARAWCEGRATQKEVRQAAAYAASAAAYAAAYAAYAAAYAAEAAAEAAAAADRARAHAECARLVRRRIPWRVVRDALGGEL